MLRRKEGKHFPEPSIQNFISTKHCYQEYRLKGGYFERESGKSTSNRHLPKENCKEYTSDRSDFSCMTDTKKAVKR